MPGNNVPNGMCASGNSLRGKVNPIILRALRKKMRRASLEIEEDFSVDTAKRELLAV